MSGYEVSLLEESIEDLEVGKRFYDQNEIGVGQYFADSALADISSLRLFAGIHPIRLGYYRMLLKRFPFAVYYEMQGTEVRVVAVLDMRRNPKGIRDALSRR